MKSGIKKFIICLVVVMIASFATAGIILLVTGNFSIKTEKIDESKNFKWEDIDKIYVDVVSTDVNIIPADKDEIKVHFYGDVSTNRNRDIPSLVAYISGGELRVEILKPEIPLIGFRVWRTELDIYIPEDSLENLKIETVSSDTMLSGISLESFDFDTVSGDFKGESLTANRLGLKTTSGDISLKDYTGNVNIKTTSGDIVLEGGSQNEDMELAAVSGNIYIEQEDSSNIDIETISGEVEINLSEDARFYLKAQTVSGDIENRFPIKIISSGSRTLEGIVGSDEKEIIISTTSGDIDIEYRQVN